MPNTTQTEAKAWQIPGFPPFPAPQFQWGLMAVPSHPPPPVLPTLTANTASNIGGVGSVLEVVSTRCRQGGFKRCRPLPIHPGHTPNLVWCQVEVAKHAAERLARIDRIDELLADLGREALLRSRPPESSLSVAVRSAALGAAAAGVPARGGAVLRLSPRPYPSGVSSPTQKKAPGVQIPGAFTFPLRRHHQR